MAFLGGTIQVIIAIALVLILCVVAFMIYNSEMIRAIQESRKVRKEVKVFTGIKDLSVSKDEVYNTIDPSHPMYRNIESSINQKAGAEYTYNFWLYVGNNISQVFGTTVKKDSATDIGLTKSGDKRKLALETANQPIVLLLRGNKTAVPFKGVCYNNSDISSLKMDVLVKQPLIKLEHGGDVLSIELNTQDKPEGVKEKSRNTCSDTDTNWELMNSYRLAVKGFTSREGLRDKWNMITLVVQDTFPSDPLPLRNKIRTRLYVNGVMELDRYVDGKLADTSSKATLLKNNQGNLYFAPVIKMTKTGASLSKEVGGSNPRQLMMADLTYFNYALDDATIKASFADGFTKSYAASMEIRSTMDDASFMDNKAFPSAGPSLSELGRA